ncbi:hypothetical protein [Hymenobacter guriensis]|uniref:Uncharacterized protein n=1 Tax=Hymenobacter guriensis TaxID=2793065 RepID=A0ABS0L266_9BACT|nr:hypothetical protein [Hymenobacter guriensis]MBG8554070.1 hypothetical protein [Hymenobacter guriensis]
MAVTISNNDHRAVWWFLTGLFIAVSTEAAYRTEPHFVRLSPAYFLGVAIMVVPVGLVCWAVWRGHYWAKLLIVAATLYGLLRPLFYLPLLHLPEFTPRLALLALALMARLAALFIIIRDLLRRPVAKEAGVAAEVID